MSVSSGIRSQFQIVSALAIREMQAQQTNLVYGYGWVFFDALLSFAGLLILRLVIRGFNKPGLPVVMFLISGLMPWMLFGASYGSPEGAVKRGKGLLVLPQVTELDLILASALRIFVTMSMLFIGLATADSLYEDVPFPRFALGVFLLYVFMSVFGTAFGVVLMFLNRLYEPAGKFVHFFLRFSLMISGVIFPISMFPSSVMPYLIWNPLLHVEDLLRGYWLYGYTATLGSPAYVAESLLVMVFFALVLERYARRRLPP